MAYDVKTRDQHYQAPGPKRILTIDGGGLRGIMSLAMLKRVEYILKSRHDADDSFRLSHYFDLIAGTSTGSVIAAGLAVGMKVDEIIEHFNSLGAKVFKKTWFRDGKLRAEYDEQPLAEELKKIFGRDMLMRDENIQTGLLVVTKRLDSGSPWPIGNNPRGQYFAQKENSSTIPNGDYPLWSVVRASTAAPTFFSGEQIEIVRGGANKKPVKGEFVDGGVSPYNNPAFQALMYATLEGYRVNWKTGADNLLIVSMGTGSELVTRQKGMVEALNGLEALMSLMDDNASLMDTLMQWMSSSPTAKEIDREVGTLDGELLGGRELMSYLRYNIPLTQDYLNDRFDLNLSDDEARDIASLDSPHNMPILQGIGKIVGQSSIKPEHFPAAFDLE